jgi:excisionase family DNA binding protein
MGTMDKNHLTFKEACEYLDLSESALYRLTSSNRIPHYKPAGKKLYFDRAELDTWLRQGRVKTGKELRQDASSRLLKRRRPLSV